MRKNNRKSVVTMADDENVNWGVAVDAIEDDLDRLLAEIRRDEDANNREGLPGLSNLCRGCGHANTATLR